MHISLPSGGYDSDGNGARVPVVLQCTSAACRNGVVNNGFLLSAYDADGNAVGSFVNWPAGTQRGRRLGRACALLQGLLPRAARRALTRRRRATQASSARAAARSRTRCRS